MAEAPSHVLSFEDARRVVEAQAELVKAPAAESVDLLAAAGRVLAESILADRDLPPFPRSTRDGYAVLAPNFFFRHPDQAKLNAGDSFESPSLT